MVVPSSNFIWHENWKGIESQFFAYKWKLKITKVLPALEKHCIWGHVVQVAHWHLGQNTSKRWIHIQKNVRPKIRQENESWQKPTSNSRFRRRRRSSSTTSIDLWPFQTIVRRIQCNLWNCVQSVLKRSFILVAKLIIYTFSCSVIIVRFELTSVE